jgi:hypothetical protein
MKKIELLKLVKSLSGAEKRFFKLYCKKQSGQKEYMDLFDIICNRSLEGDPVKIETQFKKKHPGKSYDNVTVYLLKIITDSLIQISVVNDKWFQQYQSIMRSKILFERSLPKEGYKEIKRAQKLASELEDNLTQFHCSRVELNYFSDTGFGKMEEKDLVEIQMNAKNHLRQLHLLQEHSSLYEILRLRLIHSGKSLSEEDRFKLNDLLISELSLITRGNQSNFESQKSHLLFQSFFLIHTGQFKSSLKAFSVLNSLFEQNSTRWSFPPYDYLFTLEGILDNLRTIQYFQEMAFYIRKLEILLETKYPDYFQAIALQIIYIYKLNMLINNSEPNNAILLSKAIPAALLKNDTLGDYEKRTELMFYIGLAHFCNGDFQKANKHMSKITALGKVRENSTVYKVGWLTHIIIHYELDNLDFLEYETRSYKRTFSKTGRALKIEPLIFKLIKHDPKRKNKISNLKLWVQMEKDLAEISKNNFEKQLFKYYDFRVWIKNKLI